MPLQQNTMDCPSTTPPFYQNRRLLSPLDAVGGRPHRRPGASTTTTIRANDMGLMANMGMGDCCGLSSSASSADALDNSPSSPPLTPPPFPPLQTFRLPSLQFPQDFWSIDRLQQQFGAGSEDQQRVKAAGTATARAGRRHSDQDIITRSVRAGLPTTPFVPKHKSASSDPTSISSSTSQKPQPGFSSTPPFLPWGLSPSMDPSMQPRPESSSSISTRSSFESRHKSPLSTTSSVDFEISPISPASSISNSTDDLHYSMAQNGHFRGYSKDQIPRNGEGRRQLMTPPKLSSGRLSSGPSSPTTITFGKPYQPRIAGEGFRKLPEEILFNILTELKVSHLGSASLSCSTCYMRDLVAVGASCRKWGNVARILLYEDIQIIGSDSTFHIKKKFKIKYGTRLRLLSRTLQARPDLAQYVKSLKVPTVPEAAKGGKEEEYRDLVASVIMACPNLERLPGFHTTYEHDFSRLVHALSTRRKLVERVWIISGNSSHPKPRPQPRSRISQEDCNSPELVPSPLPMDQCIEFLNFHSNWTNLQTLVMHCNPDGMLSSSLFIDVFNSLPSLENLHVSSFPASNFNDETLQLLPALKSLRLENLPGVTDEGISNFSSHARTEKLRSLSLISLSIDSLPVLARIFSHIQNLTHFTISQATCPPPVDIFLYPYLASRTVEYIHWEFTSPIEDRVTEVLSKSISHSGFPSLKTIRAPTDFEGQLQKLCKPIDKIELPGDKYRNLGGGQGGLPTSQSMPILSSPTRSHFGSNHSYSGSTGSKDIKSPTSTRSTGSCSSSSSGGSSEKGISLALSRRMAQLRIEAAKLRPQFHVITWDENGDFVERRALGGFLGQSQSRVCFTLKPDLEGSDDSIMGIEALFDGSEEGNVKDGCTGSWNLDLGGRVSLAGKKEKDRWRHTERGRWRDVDVGLLF